MRLRPPVGLLGRIFAILLLAVGLELAVSTLLYERASELRVAEEEAHRLADLLEQASRLMNDRAPAERDELAERLSTDTFSVRWRPAPMPEIPDSAALHRMRDQVLHWEPQLAESDIAFQLKSADGLVRGQFELDDESWVEFRAAQIVESSTPRFTRIVLALVPAIALVLIGGLLLRQMLAPLRMLSVAAGKIGDGDRIRLPESGVGEIGRVVVAFNDMQERIHQLIADRIEALASMGHDLRTPRATVLGSATTLIDYGSGMKPAVRDDLLLSIREEAERLNRYVGDLLDMTKLEGGALVARRDWIDVRDVIAAALARVSRRLGQRRALRDFPAELSMVRADPVLLEQVLVNILENAITYSEDGALIETAAFEDRGNVVISIEDEGRGIPTAELERVFEKFRRLEEAIDRGGERGKGAGLGLAIAKGFVEAMGGRIAAASPIRERPDGSKGGTRILISLRKDIAGGEPEA